MAASSAGERSGSRAGAGSDGRSQHRERVRDLEPPRAEAEHRRGAPTRGTVCATPSGRLDRAAAHEDAFEVRRRDVVSERGLVDLGEFRERELPGSEREGDVRVRELPAEAFAPCECDGAVVEGRRWEGVDRMPAGVVRDARLDPERDEPDVRGRELPALRVPPGVAPGTELLEVLDVPQVDLRSEVAEDRGLERLTEAERSAGKGPRTCERVAGPLPQEHLESARAHLEHDRERGVRRMGWGCRARLRHEVID